MAVALIDGDIIAYEAGFVKDVVFYTVGRKRFRYHKTAKQWCTKYGKPLDAIVKHHEPGDLFDTLAHVDEMIDGILEDTDCDEAKIFLTGADNYRIALATSHPYKGNRKGSHKPHHFQAIRDHLIEEWGAEEVNGIEADDKLGIEQYAREDTVLCSIDKDLLMIEGWHYNWRKKKHTLIEPLEGWRNFYKQCLTGDATDNIIGLKRVGEKTAESLLKNCKTPQEMLDVVIREYNFREGENALARLTENAHLLYIQRAPNDRWSFNKHTCEKSDAK